MNLDYEAAGRAYAHHKLPFGTTDLSEADKRAVKAVVDAAVPKPCEHGNRDPHLLAVLENFERVECDGKPEADND